MIAPDPEAVYFSPGDYAGFWRRLVVEVVDVLAVCLLIAVVTAIVALVDPADEPSESVLAIIVMVGLALIYWYFVILKRSRFSTVGYRLGRVRLVDVYGRVNRPGFPGGSRP